MPTYLEDLALRLAGGIAKLSPEVRQRHADFLLAAQNSDGGFSGREGPSDLYYTSFALRSLAMLGQLQRDCAHRAAGFLSQRLAGQAAVIDFLSLIYAAKLLDWAAGVDVFASSRPNWQGAVAATLEEFRRPDGGYAKTHEGAASSTYNTFLVVLCLELIDRPLADADRLVEFARSRQREDGGFVEIDAMRTSGTNPTAAAVALLKRLDGLDLGVRDMAAAFVAAQQTDEGGLRANSRIPTADLLSTFTGLLTLVDLDAAHKIDIAALARYVKSLEQPTGGFYAAAWDQVADVEYTFYGSGNMALIATLGGADHK